MIGHTDVTQGTCLDVGCGSGYLGVALAEMTELYIHFFDLSADMLEITREKITASDLGMRANTIQGDVRAIDLADESVNLAVSRGGDLVLGRYSGSIAGNLPSAGSPGMGLYRWWVRIESAAGIHRDHHAFLQQWHRSF